MAPPRLAPLIASLLLTVVPAGCRFDEGGVGLVGPRPGDGPPLADLGPGADGSTDGGPAEASVDGSLPDGPPVDRPTSDGPMSDGQVSDGSNTSWWDPAWTRRRQLSFDNAAGAEDLELFVVLVVLDTARIDYAATKKNGDDLRFVDADQATVLPHEIERWQKDGFSYVWVRVPRIDKLSSTDHIWLYYGNPAVKALPPETKQEVWDDGFAAVYHLGDLKDSAGSLDAKDHGSVAAGDGRVGGGRYFDGQAYVDLPKDSAFDLEQLTVELWFKSDQVWDGTYWPASATLISRATVGDGSGDWTIVGGRGGNDVGDAGKVIVGVGTAGEPTMASQGGLNDGSYHYVVWTRTVVGGQGEGRLYVDGLQHALVSDSGASIVADRPIQIGGDQDHSGGSYLEGEIDEVRISRVPRSAGWIAAQQASMSGGLVIHGPEEAQP